MDHKSEYEKWRYNSELPEDIKKQLQLMEGNDEEIYEAFCRDLEFGTAGIRGIMGAGTNRINTPVIKRVTQGISDYMNENFKDPAAAICYDSRINSRLFAEETAAVLTANGIKAYVYKQLMPVSALSFAVREIPCHMGIMITASHNSKEYNGYKVYNSQGCQILNEVPGEILSFIKRTDIFKDIKSMTFEEALKERCEFISEDIEEAYIKKAFSYSIPKDMKGFRLVYTPLNGTGKAPVKKLLSLAGLDSISIVKEQEEPDGCFTTCPYPNPEIPEVYDLAARLCREVKGDLIMATDPDCDRVGIAVPKGDSYKVLSGNQIGTLLFDYICKNKKLPRAPVAVRTIVSTSIIDHMAAKKQIEIKETLIGFKYIGEQIRILEEAGQEERYIFGFEEGNGYLAGSYVRDKDAVTAAMLICQMAAWHKGRGRDLTEALEEIYEEYGYYREKVLNFTFEGAKGIKKMKRIMDFLRKNQRNGLFHKKTIGITDYLKGKKYIMGDPRSCSMVAGEKPTELPQENIMEFRFSDGSKLIARPSGTEPKLKVYLFARARDMQSAEKIISEMEKNTDALICKQIKGYNN
ncbi:MAG: phospho-sugar mutase [Eubacteriales bacterium]|nr:phospho-sugar mutase [Eubacteriales bacterium]NLF47510.1 phospho-sugar mutase [Clostridiales bacterium]